jgi:hypothetical protein
MRSRVLHSVVSGSTLLTALAASILTSACGDSGNGTPDAVAPTGSTAVTSSNAVSSSTTSSTTISTGGTTSNTASSNTAPSGTTNQTTTSQGATGTSTGQSSSSTAGGSSGGSSTSGGSGATSSGQTSSAPPVEVTWTNSGSTWSATIGATTFKVDEAGGRIVGYALADTELLVDESDVAGDNANNFGSTFWLSPQSAWNDDGWPPPTHMDSEEYAGAAAGETLTLTGPQGSASGSDNTNALSVNKVFTPDAAHNAITVEYEIKNNGTSASTEWAPWQITRVPSEGITFFPSGVTVPGLKAELSITAQGDYSFWQYDADDISDDDGETHGDKFIGDGTGGWLAHVHEGVLLLLQFTDTVPDNFAPDDGEIAIYASAADPYIEIEPQGGLVSIPANGTSSWKVRWSLHVLPDEVAAEPGEALGAFAQGIATELGAP